MKRILGAFLTSVLLLSNLLSAAALENENFSHFSKRADYTPKSFSDVPSDAWFEPGVRSAFELGLMTGVGGGRFDPEGNITIAETLTLADRLHCIYTTGSMGNFGSGTPWYQPYVDYALANHMIWDGQFPDYTVLASRVDFALILSAALPEEGWAPINQVNHLPDVDAGSSYTAAILKLYNAGILTGSDNYGSFRPFTNITRGEVAAIVTRMAVPSQRKTFTLAEKPVEVENVTLTGPDSVYTGATITLTPQISPANATDRSVKWNCSDWSVADVSPEGVVTGTKAGTAVITATAVNGKVAEKTVTVVKTPSISAPDPVLVYNGTSTDSSILFKDKSGLGFCTNSVNGVEVSWSARNISGKVINYYTCYFSMYNAVGDPARDTISGKSTKSIKVVGPVQPGDSLLCSKNIIGYSGVCSKVVLDRIYLEYADGTTEMVEYGYSGGETLWDKYNNNWW